MEAKSSECRLPSQEYIIQTRWYGGQIGCLPRGLDDRYNDNVYLARIPLSSQVGGTMKWFLEKLAEVHVDEDIRLSPLDDPRNYLFATYSGGANLSANTEDKPILGTSGIVATLGTRLVFCQNKKTFAIAEGMCFWGWVGMKHRVAWRQHNAILRDTNGDAALPHDADKRAVDCWKEIGGDSLDQHVSSNSVGRYRSGLMPLRITDEILRDTCNLFEPFSGSLDSPRSAATS